MLYPAVQDKAIKKEDLFDFKSSSFNKEDLTFRDLIYEDNNSSRTKDIKALGDHIKKNFKRYVVVGIGGSDLGSRAIVGALKRKSNTEISFIGANTDPDQISDFFDEIKKDLDKTVFNIISKSGETVEIISVFLYIMDFIKQNLGPSYISKNIYITTSSPQSSLYRVGKKEGISIIEGESSVGDRFSVLSVIGMLTAEVMGLDSREFLEGAREIDNNCSSPNPFSNDALMFAELNFLSYKLYGKNIGVVMPYAEKLRSFAFWYRQLWAESLGKKIDINGNIVNTGITPIASLGSTDQHSQIQLYNEGPNDLIVTFIFGEIFDNNPQIKTEIKEFEYLNGKGFRELISIEREATALSLRENQRSNGTIILDNMPSKGLDPKTMGGLFYFFELACAYLGNMLEIDTFNQPGVEKGKEYMYTLLSKPGFEKEKQVLSAKLKNG